MTMYRLLLTGLFLVVAASLLSKQGTFAEIQSDVDHPPAIPAATAGDNNGWTEESLRTALVEARKSLKESPVLTTSAIEEQLRKLTPAMQSLEYYHQKIDQAQQQISRLVQNSNVNQVQQFQQRLEEILKKELNFRRQYPQQDPRDDSDRTTMQTVSQTELQEELDTAVLLYESEDALKEWVLSVMMDELKVYNQKVEKSTKRPDRASRASVAAGECPTMANVVQDAQSSISIYAQDTIGIVDHVQGGHIVHSMTSPTYSPPPKYSELLGNVWWRKYIPQDWELLLPEGWEHWSTALPSFLYHTMSLQGSKVAPPETILQKKVLPGSCWPMTGSRGQVTVQLPYPVKVDTFSIDHVLSDILPDGMEHSAPKTIQVIAYPPCSAGDQDCAAIGFDRHDPMQVAQFDYDVEAGTSVQTFASIFASSSAAGEEIADDPSPEESCSAEAAACSSPPKIDVAGLTLKIRSNHGNPDYTCLYRFRVHGEQVLG